MSSVNGKGYTMLNVVIIREGHTKKVTFELRRENDDKATIWIPGNRAFQQEGTVDGKGLETTVNSVDKSIHGSCLK